MSQLSLKKWKTKSVLKMEMAIIFLCNWMIINYFYMTMKICIVKLIIYCMMSIKDW